MDERPKSLEYTITLVLNKDSIPACDFIRQRNAIERWVHDGLRTLCEQFMIDPGDAKEDIDDETDPYTGSYISSARMEQTYGDR